MIALLLSLALAQDVHPDSDATQDAPAARASYRTAAIVLAVGDRRVATDALIAKATALGGYFSVQTDDHLVLRVPVQQLEALTEGAEALGLVTDRRLASNDLGGELTDLRARLTAREQMLTQLQALLPTASAEAIVTVEREITRLISEIEYAKGRLRLLEHRAAPAGVDAADAARPAAPASPTRLSASELGSLSPRWP